MTDPILTDVLANAKSSVRIQDDLYRWVNGAWIDSHEIPADRSSDGSFMRLRDRSEEQVHEIITELAGSQSAQGDAKKIADYFSSFMAVDAINEAGTAPLAEDVERVVLAATKEALANAVGTLLRTGVSAPFGFDIDADLNDPETYRVFLYQSGLSLPDEAFYRQDQHRETYEAFQAFVPELFEVSGLVPDPQAAARHVIDIEAALAAHHDDVVTTRDTDKINNPMSWDEFVAALPGFDWNGARDAYGLTEADVEQVLVMTPAALAGAAKVWEDASLDALKDYLVWRILVARASLLDDTVSDKHFSFFGTRLTGATERKERWKRGVDLVSTVLGEAIGKVYVGRHFPPKHKAKMEQLVADLLEAYRGSIKNLDWMSEETKTKALAKLATFNPKIGYPDEWRDYSALEIGPDDVVANVRAANSFETDRGLKKLGTPMDRSEWYMPPQMVNAYYNPTWNEIVFPAAILQPPFFDPEADAAWNYGGIGAVIGHEIGHGFDDQGSKYDETGRLNNWWTESDRIEFEKRTKALIAQYDAYTPAQLGESEHHVNGALTIGENIGDLGGLTIGLKAYDIALKREGLAGLSDAPTIEGTTGVQRLFYSYARIWQNKSRDELAVMLLSVDPHSPAEFRCNGVVKNVDAFAEAFGVSEGDALYLAPEERVRIW